MKRFNSEIEISKWVGGKIEAFSHYNLFCKKPEIAKDISVKILSDCFAN